MKNGLLILLICTKEGWLYLAVVLDLFSRKVVGWSMDEIMEKALVINALSMAVKSRQPQKGLLHHSDQGSQYASADYQKLLRNQQITCSISRKGNCYDNALVESFFSTLKQELVFQQAYLSRQHAKQDIFEYIEVKKSRILPSIPLPDCLPLPDNLLLPFAELFMIVVLLKRIHFYQQSA